MKNFKDLKIWQKGFEIAVNSHKLTETFPRYERFGLSNQINRAGISIPSNVAEGSSRRSPLDYNRFIEISQGSCFELETQLLVARELKFGDQNLLLAILGQLKEEEKMLSAFGKVLMAAR